MMFLGVVGKRFGDGGYRDLRIQSEVIGEGSVERTLSGKMYNRPVRAVKLTYEALSRILLRKFLKIWKEKIKQFLMNFKMRSSYLTKIYAMKI